MISISIRIEDEIVAKLDDFAKADHRPRNNLIALILHEWVRAQTDAQKK